MIKCSNCGTLNIEISQVCGSCGMSLSNNANQNNNQIQNNMNNTNNNQIQNNINNANNNQTEYYYFNQTVPKENQIDNGVLVDAYIGENVEKLRNGSFSWCSLFFSGFYFWYRKMYTYLGIWFAITFVLSFAETIIERSFTLRLMPTPDAVVTIFDIIGYIVVLIMAFPFKGSYLNHVKGKVLKIRNQNPNKTEEELIEICKRKGGTTSAPFIFFASLFVIAFIIGYVI